MPKSLSAISTFELVESFLSITLQQYEAERHYKTRKYNRLYDEMETVKAELKGRAGDQRRALLPLLQHPNVQVRLMTAIALLAVEPDRAKATLVEVSDAMEVAQAADAAMMLEALEEGEYIPS
ncbi:hypothetical protein X566_15615 [Afipia sp. P52-10]|jgi:hypothetical protein|uniref:DUF2019 domain-containing protein n=1 Tax=Afipia sp. P52-10 TaxID=1429916 RepID=UPI0003DF05CD|nr:DUF2019 domain-containing protein [Afipia sp. P52-10]ETR76019.1 hypothetical protein X566_15615 [Afipia sp. P52-10]